MAPSPGISRDTSKGIGKGDRRIRLPSVRLLELNRKIFEPTTFRTSLSSGSNNGARIEVLKGMRSMLDARIDHLSQHDTKGTKVNVE